MINVVAKATYVADIVRNKNTDNMNPIGWILFLYSNLGKIGHIRSQVTYVARSHTWIGHIRGQVTYVARSHTWLVTYVARSHTWPGHIRGQVTYVARSHTWLGHICG